MYRRSGELRLEGQRLERCDRIPLAEIAECDAADRGLELLPPNLLVAFNGGGFLRCLNPREIIYPPELRQGHVRGRAPLLLASARSGLMIARQYTGKCRTLHQAGHLLRRASLSNVAAG